MTQKRPRNVTPLNPAPVPLKSKDWVLVNECSGEWTFAPRSLVLDSQAQTATLGKLYDWRFYRDRDDGVPAKFIGTNDSVLHPLLNRSLIKHKAGKYRITSAGARVYVATYWVKEHWLERRREENRKRLAIRQDIYYRGSLNNTDEPRWKI